MAVNRRASRRRYVLLVLVLTATTLITLDNRSDDDGPLGVVGRAAHAIVSPVEKATDGVAEPVGDWFAGITDRGSLKDDNEKLRRRVDELEDERRRAREALRQNKILKQLAELPILDDVDDVWARVVNVAAGNFERTVTIDKGSDQGISPDMPVVGPAGVVGTVLESWAGGAKIRMLADPDSGVSVRVTPAQVSGVARGRAGSDLLTLDLDDPDAAVEVGDDVVTSGLENSDFPEGLSVGRVVDVEDEAGRLGKTLRVEPWTDFDQVEFLRVLLWVPGSGPVVSTTTTTTTTTVPMETTTTTTEGDDH